MSAPKPARIQGIDVARGIASILMVQGHAFDAWASAPARETTWYAIESTFLQTLALPAFLVLAGASLALRVNAASAKGEELATVRRGVVRRALQIVAVGYALNAFSAIVDGWEGIETWLRADVLQVIGLSLLALGLAVRGDGRALGRVAWVMAIVPVVICPWVSRASHEIVGPLGWVLAPFVDVPPITRMPWVPLASWAAAGVLLARAMIANNREARSAGGASPRFVIALLFGAASVAALGTWAQDSIVAALGGPLDRRHVAVIANAVQLAARGGLVLGVGAAVAPGLPERVRWLLVTMGRGSLWAYAFHVPLCYGRFAEWSGLRGSLSIAECAAAAAVLVIASWCAAWCKGWRDARRADSGDHLRRRRRK